jgi:holliday junction DNA helicase RuvA
MIGFLSGTLAGRAEDGCLLNVHGVGYALSCSSATLAALPGEGKPTRLYTHLQVRDDALVLFGFASEAERYLFELLLGVSGVGPRVALGLCSALSPEEFRRALVSEDAGALAAVPGVGKKTAARIVLDLKEKLSLPDLQVTSNGANSVAEARSALENLGYSGAEVRSALSEVGAAPDDPVGAVIKSALKVLA